MSTIDRFRLDGRVVVVTGASTGFGARFARVLAGAGAQVTVTARRADRLQAVAGEIGGRAVPADITVAADRERLAEAVGERVDVLVNNAGIAAGGPPEEFDPEQLRRLFDVNVVAPFALSQLFGRRMLARGAGSIINVASVTALVSSPRGRSTGYSASKAALLSLTRNLAVAWARRGCGSTPWRLVGRRADRHVAHVGHDAVDVGRPEAGVGYRRQGRLDDQLDDGPGGAPHMLGAADSGYGDHLRLRVGHRKQMQVQEIFLYSQIGPVALRDTRS